MHTTRTICAAACSLLIAGCNLQDDLNHPGGLFGKYADGLIPGANKSWQVYRGVAAFALVSSTATFTVQSPAEAKIFYEAMNLVESDLARLRKISISPDCNADKRPKIEANQSSLACKQHFEALVPIFEGHLLKLAGYALPAEAYDKVRRAMSSGISMSTVTAVLDVTSSMLSVGHNVAGTYRAQKELYANELRRACETDEAKRKPVSDVAEATAVIDEYSRTCGATDLARYKPDEQSLAGLYDLIQEACITLRSRSVVEKKSTSGEKKTALEYEIASCTFQIGAADAPVQPARPLPEPVAPPPEAVPPPKDAAAPPREGAAPPKKDSASQEAE